MSKLWMAMIVQVFDDLVVGKKNNLSSKVQIWFDFCQ